MQHHPACPARRGGSCLCRPPDQATPATTSGGRPARAETAPPARERLLRIEDVAAWTGVPENTLRFWRHQGTGPRSAKLGRRIAYRESDVQAWIDQQFGQELDQTGRPVRVITGGTDGRAER